GLHLSCHPGTFAMKFPPRFAAALALSATLLVVSSVLPDDPKPAPGPKADKGLRIAATVKVERGPFKATVSLKGVFAAAETAEVVLRPEAWGSGAGGGFVVVSAV